MEGWKNMETEEEELCGDKDRWCGLVARQLTKK
jgi:hypothetical protein